MSLPNNRDHLLSRINFYSANSGVAFAHEILTLSTANSTPLASVPAGTRYAIVQVNETTTSGSVDVIRYWTDGTNPTATEGIVRGDMDAFDISGEENIRNFRAIRLSANAHTLQVQYYK